MRKSTYLLVHIHMRIVPSDNHRSIVTLCLPTVTRVPGGSVPAGTFLVGMTLGGAVSDAVFERLARDELCEE